MPQSEPEGLPELREVIGRYAKRAGLRRLTNTPGAMDQVVNHLYHGTSEGPLKHNDPYLRREEWGKLAHLGNAEPKEKVWDNDLVFGQSAKTQRDMMMRGQIGPGYNPDDVVNFQMRTGQKQPANFQLSPGDQQSHSWLRDSEFLHSMLKRKAGEDEGKQRLAMSAAAGGDGSPVETPLQRALDFYRRSGESPQFSHGSYAGDPFATSNYRQYAGLQGMLEAMNNPEFAAGRAMAWTKPIGHFFNRMTTKNPSNPHPDWIRAMETKSVGPADRFMPGASLVPAIGALAGAGYDFLSNLGESLTDESGSISNAEIGRDVYEAMAQPYRQWPYAISPIIPENANTPEERADAIGRARGDSQKSWDGLSYDDYFRSKTGMVPSYLGSGIGSVASEAPFDPSTLLSALLGGGVPRLAGEAGEEFVTGVPFVFGINAAYGAQPPLNQWSSPGIENRPDLQEEHLPDDEFLQEMKNYNANVRNADNESMRRTFLKDALLGAPIDARKRILGQPGQ